MNDTRITVVGNLVDDPRLRETKLGVKVASFRIASTSRRYDRENECWVDNETLYVTVTSWRWMAENVAASLRKGQPVIATGRLYTREYKVEENLRVSYELDADSVGHDLARGRSEFARVRRPGMVTMVQVDGEGKPADLTDHRIEVVELPEPELAAVS